MKGVGKEKMEEETRGRADGGRGGGERKRVGGAVGGVVVRSYLDGVWLFGVFVVSHAEAQRVFGTFNQHEGGTLIGSRLNRRGRRRKESRKST